MALRYQGGALDERVRPLANEVGGDLLIECDVSDMTALDVAFDTLAARWPTIDFVLHAIGFSDKNELRGKFVDTSLENFLLTLNVDRKSVVSGKSVSVRVDLGGRRLIKKKKQHTYPIHTQK